MPRVKFVRDQRRIDAKAADGPRGDELWADLQKPTTEEERLKGALLRYADHTRGDGRRPPRASSRTRGKADTPTMLTTPRTTER